MTYEDVPIGSLWHGTNPKTESYSMTCKVTAHGLSSRAEGDDSDGVPMVYYMWILPPEKAKLRMYQLRLDCWNELRRREEGRTP